jgi:hypothetical protein
VLYDIRAKFNNLKELVTLGINNLWICFELLGRFNENF